MLQKNEKIENTRKKIQYFIGGICISIVLFIFYKLFGVINTDDRTLISIYGLSAMGILAIYSIIGYLINQYFNKEIEKLEREKE